MSKSSPAFKAAFSAYCQAVNDGADRSVLDPLWQAVMRALHDTPEPPVGLYASTTTTAPGCKFSIGVDKASGVDQSVVALTAKSAWMSMWLFGSAAWPAPIDRHAPSPLDDDFDRMMREG